MIRLVPPAGFSQLHMTAPQSPSEVSTQLQKLGIAAADELRKTVRAALTEVLGKFLQQLPAALQEASSKPSSPSERDELSSLSRTVATVATRWSDTFIQQVDARLIGGAEAPADGSEANSGDDSIAMAHIELRAEERYQKLVTELDARFNRIRLMLYVPVFPRALAPAGLFRALQDTADAMKWPPRYRGLLLEKFDQLVVADLERVYRALVESLNRIGTAAAKATAEAPAKPTPKPPARPPQSPTQMQPPVDPRQVDQDTKYMLEQLALKGDAGTGYSDSLLASDLLALSDNKPLPGVAKDTSWVPLQRISLAGHFLNVVISDAMVPPELKPQHESVRFPLMKSALTDDTLFTSITHPLGSLIHEMLLKSATSRVTGNSETRRMAELLQQVLVQFDLAPEFVRQAMRASSPIQETQIQRFYELQRQQAQQRRDFVIAEAKRVVVRQLEQATFGREIPATALRFLNQAWGPLLTKRLLQFGADSPQWKAAIALMDQMLDLVEARDPNSPATPDWKALLQSLAQMLIAEGMATDRARDSVALLDAARSTKAGSLG
jgi:hypothetical protein